MQAPISMYTDSSLPSLQRNYSNLKPIRGFYQSRLDIGSQELDLIRGGFLNTIFTGYNSWFRMDSDFNPWLKYGDGRCGADALFEGDIVERPLGDMEAVLFNQHPSLHKLSIPSHFVQYVTPSHPNHFF